MMFSLKLISLYYFLLNPTVEFKKKKILFIGKLIALSGDQKGLAVRVHGKILY